MNTDTKIKLLDAMVTASKCMAVLAQRAFCPTGQGGGVDPSCGSGGGGGGHTPKPISEMRGLGADVARAALKSEGLKSKKPPGATKTSKSVMVEKSQEDTVAHLEKKGWKKNPDGDGRGTSAVRLDKAGRSFVVSRYVATGSGDSSLDSGRCKVSLYEE